MSSAKVDGVLQAAVTVSWCVAMVVAGPPPYLLGRRTAAAGTCGEALPAAGPGG